MGAPRAAGAMEIGQPLGKSLAAPQNVHYGAT